MQRATIEDWDEYESFFAEFYRHVLTVVLRMEGGAPDGKEYYWKRCTNLLNKAFGASGYKAAFEMARTGKEGGLYGVVKSLADLMVDIDGLDPAGAVDLLEARINEHERAPT